MLKDFEIFELVHKVPLTVGMSVRIDPMNKYAGDWPGEVIVTGLQWVMSSGKTNITLSDSWDDIGSDGWTTNDIFPFITPPKPVLEPNGGCYFKPHSYMVQSGFWRCTHGNVDPCLRCALRHPILAIKWYIK